MAGTTSTHAVAGLNAQIEDLKNVMGQNIHLMLKRGENLDALIDKTEELQMDSKVFTKRATALKRQTVRKSCKQSMCISFGTAGVIALAVIIIVGIIERR